MEQSFEQLNELEVAVHGTLACRRDATLRV